MAYEGKNLEISRFMRGGGMMKTGSVQVQFIKQRVINLMTLRTQRVFWFAGVWKYIPE